MLGDAPPAAVPAAGAGKAALAPANAVQNGQERPAAPGGADAPQRDGRAALDAALAALPQLTPAQVEELAAAAVARKCFLQQRQHLAAFQEGFMALVDADFRANQPELLAAFQRMVAGMQLTLTEQAWESSGSGMGTVTIVLPGLPDGVTVTRTTDSFFVDEGNTLLQRSEARVKLGGLGVYSGYWLAVDAPAGRIEDPLQEEGVDTLRRVMEAAGLLNTEAAYEDALEYPFLSALLAPFGPEAVGPFEEHLRAMHGEYGHRHGGAWFRMASPRKQRARLAQVAEEGGEDAEAAGGAAPVRRQRMTEAEEAEAELDRLDL